MPMRVAYCTNVAPVSDLDGLVTSLAGLWSDVRRQVGGAAPLGLGLWLPDQLAEHLATDADARHRLRGALERHELELVTINAFPMREFHAPVVKHRVYEPNWTDQARLDYTLNVARAASDLLPPGSDITLSTLPLLHGKWGADVLEAVAGRLVLVALRLAELEQETGTVVRLALEPEPCCALETTTETIEFFRQHVDGSGDRDRIRRHLGVCLDLCHTSVAHEDPLSSLERYAEVGIAVHKIQVSAALEVPNPGDPAQRAKLAAFEEPRWLHQVGRGPGDVVEDIGLALEADQAREDLPWRVHFHVPLHAAEVGGLPTTRATVERTLSAVAKLPDPPVLELETYTWSVVPGATTDLASNVANEIRWVQGRLGSA